jgi:hypothetical protein
MQSADQVSEEDDTPTSPQYFLAVEVYHRRPASHVLRELARALELDYNTLPTLGARLMWWCGSIWQRTQSTLRR